MIEVLWHGRGGQGAFTAARLLGAAASLAPGRYALAFPSFGPERRGAPMRAFTKMDSAKIGDRSAISKADFVVYLDETLFGEGWESELKEGGVVLVNSVRRFDDPRVVPFDANGISLAILGREIPNTTFLAAVSVLSDALSPDDAREAVRQYMAPKLHRGNLAVIDEVERLLADGLDAYRASLASADTVGQDEPEGTVGAVSQPVLRNAPAPRERVIPELVGGELDPFEFARTTCWTAGHLVSKNAGWRVYRPVLDAEKCTGCLQCYMQCPDGTVYKVADPEGSAPVAVDYDFCKGCGVCVRACRFGALEMQPEGKVR